MNGSRLSSIDLPKLAAGLDNGSVAGTKIEVAGQEITIADVLTTDQTQVVLYSLRNGQNIPAHRHTAIDDIFLGVRGRGRVKTWDEKQVQSDHPIQAGSIYAVAPGTVHELVSESDDFAYVLMQFPKEDYDLIPVDPPA